MRKNKKSKWVFLLPIVGHARHEKRIQIIGRRGVDTVTYAFKRPGHPLDSNIDHTILGTVEHGNYGRRLWTLIRASIQLWKEVNDADVVYAFGLDLLLLGWLATLGQKGGKKIIYELGDLPQKELEGTLKGGVVRAIESLLLSTVACLVVTSQAYLDDYFYKHYDLSAIDCRIIENKLDPKTTPPMKKRWKRDKKARKEWKIGYFGLLRCRRSWKTLKRLVRYDEDQFELYLRGIPMKIDSLPRQAEGIPNVEYGGPYQNPKELPDMYAAIDLSWVAYQHSSDAEWVRSNRFYEACYFQTPMVGQEGTLDGEIIEKYNIGFLIDVTQSKETVERIMRITEREWKRWKRNLEQLPASVYTYTDEHRTLVESCRKSAKSTHVSK